MPDTSPALNDFVKHLANLIAAQVKAGNGPPPASPLRLEIRKNTIGRVTLVPYRGEPPHQEGSR